MMDKYIEIYKCKRCGQEVRGLLVGTEKMIQLRINAKDMLNNIPYLHECSDGKLGIMEFIGYDKR